MSNTRKVAELADVSIGTVSRVLNNKPGVSEPTRQRVLDARALVGRQPFGGFGLSGVGSKAGGRDYLLQFVEPRASCENTLRRGFAPEL